jgi:hypothetical protein
MLGAVALLQYLATRYDEYMDCSTIMDCSTMPDGIDGGPWPAIVFRTLASALVQVQP